MDDLSQYSVKVAPAQTIERSRETKGKAVAKSQLMDRLQQPVSISGQDKKALGLLAFAVVIGGLILAGKIQSPAPAVLDNGAAEAERYQKACMHNGPIGADCTEAAKDLNRYMERNFPRR